MRYQTQAQAQAMGVMIKSFASSKPLTGFFQRKKIISKRYLMSFDLEITARCNNNCRHCYINLPAADKESAGKELSLEEIKSITDEAVSAGALWCLLTGGEPLLREDFLDIYLCLKKKGLLVSVFTNATLITKEHISIFKRYPPRDIEVTVYGITAETYDNVTRNFGSYTAFMHGLNLLLKNGIKVRLKAMALRSNLHELSQITRFCRERTRDYFRFDPFLHLRFDGNQERSEDIKSERLLPEEIVALERDDPERLPTLKKECSRLITPKFSHINCNHLFRCGAGNNSFVLSYDGFFCLCSSLRHPDCLYELKKGNLSYAWNNFVPQVRDLRSNRKEFLERCRSCRFLSLCFWCPAHAYLETGEMDTPIDCFCETAHARVDMLNRR